MNVFRGCHSQSSPSSYCCYSLQLADPQHRSSPRAHPRWHCSPVLRYGVETLSPLQRTSCAERSLCSRPRLSQRPAVMHRQSFLIRAQIPVKRDSKDNSSLKLRCTIMYSLCFEIVRVSSEKAAQPDGFIQIVDMRPGKPLCSSRPDGLCFRLGAQNQVLQRVTSLAPSATTSTSTGCPTPTDTTSPTPTDTTCPSSTDTTSPSSTDTT